jgi:hypothetical protein
MEANIALGSEPNKDAGHLVSLLVTLGRAWRQSPHSESLTENASIVFGIFSTCHGRDKPGHDALQSLDFIGRMMSPPLRV